MGWITRGATTLVERSRTITVHHELIEYGNAIVYAMTYDPVTANDGSTVVVAVAGKFPDVVETLPGLTTFVEKAKGAHPWQEL
jgi:uncharacterized Fe-S center protein